MSRSPPDGWFDTRHGGPFPFPPKRFPETCDPMYVCLCRRVTDRCVRSAIAAGARDPEAVARSCRAGSGCGGCRAVVEAMLAAAGNCEGGGRSPAEQPA